MTLMIYFELTNSVTKKHNYSLYIRYALPILSSFDPLSMCAKVERITTKTGCPSCTNWTISYKVRGLQWTPHTFQGHLISPNLYQLKTLVCIQHQTFKATY